jgi:acetylornithine/N-succinyldiaminopimelate aminotransferase
VSTLEEIQSLDAQHVMQTYGRLPVAFVRGEGSRLWDSEGNEYLDFLGGLAVVSLGHAHPQVADALAEQARTLLHVSNLYYNEVQPQVAARLDALLGGDGRVFFANSGAEANECAIKLARRHGQGNGGPERYHVLSAYASFHGRTLTTLAATGQPQKQEVFQPLPSGFRQVGFGDIEQLRAAMDERVCAVLLEAIQGEGGVNPVPAGYLEAVRALCDEREALLIVDEVQTGLGRTGKWFGFQHAEGVRPDVVTMAKALGNGVPIGACWARDEIATAFRPGDHATTFGGQPFAARAALTVLEIMEAEDVPTRALRAGARLAAGLAALPGVTHVRGKGLLLAAELAPPLESAKVAMACLDAGSVHGNAGSVHGNAGSVHGNAGSVHGNAGSVHGNVGLVLNNVTPTALRFEPSLLVSDAEIDAAVAILGDVLEAQQP